MATARTMTKSNQSFEVLVSNNYFYVDKTRFIGEWWRKGEAVTLITRPRRFGKTMTISMVERFSPCSMKGSRRYLLILIFTGHIIVVGRRHGTDIRGNDQKPECSGYGCVRKSVKKSRDGQG